MLSNGRLIAVSRQITPNWSFQPQASGLMSAVMTVPRPRNLGIKSYGSELAGFRGRGSGWSFLFASLIRGLRKVSVWDPQDFQHGMFLGLSWAFQSLSVPLVGQHDKE